MQSQPEFLTLRRHLEQTIVGQTALIDRLMVGMLTGGHILLESAPGLAKTTAVKALAAGVHASFQRLQFTPDLLPADITGGDIFDPTKSEFRFVQGPLFHEIILADEINRAPPKVQSALLEAMEEHQVTISGKSWPLPDLFIVMATQNPLEQGGTYPLPEAQLDRFLLHVIVDYPDADEELQILERDRQRHFSEETPSINTRLDPQTVLKARQEVADIHIEPALERYVVDIVQATRNPARWGEDLKETIQFGASPRATLAMVRAACAHAYLQGREYVLPDDVLEVAGDVLRHRIIPSYTARARGRDAQSLIEQLLDVIPVP
ncbi:AAA family ATPase [Thiohalophilus thiocyanatoxydans]|uniref:MoxR-like ATPase n=1 Tax=Thiohalophilus thiocyanatoxydans TaxID=381308 RepID=A0A4R8IPG5_9GAMM|nr:MoxR family ATPase [Thiohalophilus thiocyanatoxydans]TDY02821.1 MoxR-like ATPase [Thiohalophilus thiocyanatoxydans]